MSDISPLPCCTCNKCTCNVTQKVLQMQQDHRLLQFMMKLNEKFATVRGNVLMQQPLSSISNAFRVFYQEERHHELSQLTTQTESLAFLTDNKRKPTYVNSQKQLFHSNINNQGTKKGENYYCTHCKISGHSVGVSKFMGIHQTLKVLKIERWLQLLLLQFRRQQLNWYHLLLYQ